MRKSRFSDTQIASILSEAASGAPIRQLCRRHGITTTTFYRWKAQFAGLEGEGLKRLRRIEEENRRLKHIVADQALNIQVLQDTLKKDW
jgi:putative transposase